MPDDPTITQQLLEQTIGAIRDAGEAQASTASALSENTEATRRVMELTQDLKGLVEVQSKELLLRMESLEKQMSEANQQRKTWGDRLWMVMQKIPSWLVKWGPWILAGGGLAGGTGYYGSRVLQDDTPVSQDADEAQEIHRAVKEALEEQRQEDKETEGTDEQ